MLRYRPDVPMPSGADPWTDPRWADTKWTVYRDVAYDLQPFLGRAALHLLNTEGSMAIPASDHTRST